MHAGLGKKKVVRKRRKKAEENALEKNISLAVETGKVVMGYRKGIVEILKGNPKAVIVAENIDKEKFHEILYLVKLSNIPYAIYNSSKQLGVVCGRPHPVSLLVVLDEGNSSLVEVIKREGA